MHNCFVSVVRIIQSSAELAQLPTYLNNVYEVLKGNFSDYEIILVNNAIIGDIEAAVNSLPDAVKHQVYLLNLSIRTNKNNAIIAGLDRSNGDYTILFEAVFQDKPELILSLYERTREHYDIVYLKAKSRSIKTKYKLFYSIFYYILRRYSKLQIDEKAHDTRIISRRALNSVLRLRENLRYMKAIYSLVGYKTSSIEVEEQLAEKSEDSFSEQFKTSLIAITSFTTFLRSLLFSIFIFSFIFLIVVIFNALKVKFTGIDIFGNIGQAVTGWTFLVILISVFFAITCLNLYIMSIYLTNIYNEIKQRPLYIIESVKRF